MIPLRTTAPAHANPVVTMSLIVINIGVFVYHLGLDGRAEQIFVYTYALVPAVYSNPSWALRVGLDPSNFLPIVSNTFMHGGWLHLIVNMWTLWLFGIAMEERLGRWRFILFYLACGTAGSIAHLMFNLHSTVPALGASGAIAGLLGGFAWLFPRAKVAVLQPIFIFPLFFHLPALLYTALWFGLQLLQGTAALSVIDPIEGGGIAWWAHIGGFVAGLVIAILLTRPRPRRHRRGPWSP